MLPTALFGYFKNRQLVDAGVHHFASTMNKPSSSFTPQFLSTKTVAKQLSRVARLEELYGYLFISPWLIGFLIFTIGPMLVSLYWSFTKYEFPLPSKWYGVQNYVDAFSKDELFYTALWNTTYYVLFAVPLGLAA